MSTPMISRRSPASSSQMDIEQATETMLEAIGSPNIQSPPYRFDRDAQAWAERQVLEGSDVERAATPVMGNHQAQWEAGNNSASSFTPVSNSVYDTTPSFLPTGHRVKDDQKVVYGRHYDALARYLRDKRHAAERLYLAEQEVALTATTTEQQQPSKEGTDLMEIDETEPVTPQSDEISKLETMVEVKLLKSLEQAVQESLEADAWMLLWHLRQLGKSAVLWSDDEASTKEHQSELKACISSLATRVEDTPKAILEELNDGELTPVLWKRMGSLQTWLEASFAREASNCRAFPNASLKIDSDGLPRSAKESELIKGSLALILAGKMDQACELMEQSNQHWRVAQWRGGKPYGMEGTPNPATRQVDVKRVGNTKRPLWRNMMWNVTESLRNQGDRVDEAAIAALLSNHFMAGLDSPSLRSWKKGLYTVVRSFRGRTEDQLLFEHNEHRRTMRPPFPGTEFAGQEKEILRKTSVVASLSEKNMVETLQSSPYDEMKGSQNLVTRTMASFVQGGLAVAAYLHYALRQIDKLSETESRFFTHVMIYLESIAQHSSLAPNMTEAKDHVVLRYLETLSKLELWQYSALYASLLSKDPRVQRVPGLLVNVLDFPTRSKIVEQLREFLNGPAEELLQLVVDIVKLILGQKDRAKNSVTPTDMDVGKIKALEWLDVDPSHSRAYLVWSNNLLRSFLLGDKAQAALLYMRDHRSESVQALLVNQDDTHVTEHLALECFLDALTAENSWQQVLDGLVEQDNATFGDSSASQGSTVESIAQNMQRREFVEAQRGVVASLVEVAVQTQTALQSVLEYPGGWLYCDLDGDTSDSFTRGGEVERLRKKVIPQVVETALRVFLQTAEKLDYICSRMGERLHLKRSEVLRSLDPSESELPMRPTYWTDCALNLSEVVSSEQYNAGKNMSTDDLKSFVKSMSDAEAMHHLFGREEE